MTLNEIGLGLSELKTAKELANLAILAYQEQNYAESARLMRKAIAIFEEWLGANHPMTVALIENLASVEAEIGQS